MVYLIGAGPGDPGLMTVRGLECIRQAGVLVYEPGVHRSLLGEAPQEAERIRADDLRAATAAVVQAAESGRTVCWLSAGEPFEAEMALTLAGRSVPFEVVPGVSHGAAAASYAGVPAGGVGVALATLAVADLQVYVEKLHRQGVPLNTAAVVIAGATTPEQRTVSGTLAEVAALALKAGFPSPVVLVAGESVLLRERLAWFERKPLFGRRVLITRAQKQASALATKIRDCGGETFDFPVITIADPESWEPLDEAIAQIGRYRWLVVTSPNGAEQFCQRLMACGKDVRALAHLKVAAVGAATGKALAGFGIKVDVIPGEFRGAALPAAMEPHLQPGDRVLMARANLGDPAHAEGLRALGAEVDDLVAYRTLLEGGDVEELRALLQAGAIQYVTFTSSSTVNNLLERLGGREWLAGVRVAVMGPETKKAAEAAGLEVHALARHVSLDGLVRAIAEDVQSSGTQ